jgi:hypothetical protein
MLGTILAVSSLATAVLGLQFTILTKIIGMYERMVRLETQMQAVVASNTSDAITIAQLVNRVTRLEEQVRKNTNNLQSQE